MTKAIRFDEAYVINDVLFERNSYHEYYDKYETMDNGEFVWKYRIKDGDDIYVIDGRSVTEVDMDELKNPDYTETEWDTHVTTDALVDDGDYVDKWIETLGIDKPVKDTQDQADYNWVLWKNIENKM